MGGKLAEAILGDINRSSGHQLGVRPDSAKSGVSAYSGISFRGKLPDQLKAEREVDRAIKRENRP